jgi:4-amino-4-deoxy-L-arabinose transferase-like glycosyltransferase
MSWGGFGLHLKSRNDTPEEMRHAPAVPATTRGLWTIASFAVAIKAILLFGLFPYLHAQFFQHYSSESFSDGYHQIALNLVQGNGYRMYPDASLTMLRTPGYVLLLALIFAVFGKHLIVVQVVNVVFSSITAVLTHVLARRAGLSRTPAIIAALVFFYHPGTLIAETRGGVECMLTLCLAASVLCALMAIERQKLADFVSAGMLNGLAMLVKSSVAPVLPVLFLYSMWRAPDWFLRRKLLAGMVICGLATVLVMTPWVVRNYRLSGEFVPTMTLEGMAVFQGSYVIKHLDSNFEFFEIFNHASDEQTAIARSMGLRTIGWFFIQFAAVEDEVLFYRELGRRGLDQYRREPRLILQGIIHNTWYFWVGGRTHQATIFNIVLVLPLLALSGIGLKAGIRMGLDVFPFIMVTLAFMIPHLLILAVARYHIPVIPFIAILAAIPVASWFQHLTLGEVHLPNEQAREK